MNIYNSSTFGSNSLPANVTFTNVQAGEVQISGGLAIQGASRGDILICENTTSDIGGLELGPQNYVLQAGATLPQWTNSINLNTATLNGLNLVGVQAEDLIVGSGGGNIGRLPIGAANQVLFSNGTEIGWQNLNALNQAYYSFGTSGNISDTTTVLYSTTKNVIAGRRYRLTLNGQLTMIALTQITFEIPGVIGRNGTYSASGDVNVIIIWTANTTGSITLRVAGETTTGNTASLVAVNILCEEF
jgi:hypothetical protein